jgi:hypothetical protein
MRYYRVEPTAGAGMARDRRNLEGRIAGSRSVGVGRRGKFPGMQVSSTGAHCHSPMPGPRNPRDPYARNASSFLGKG